MSTIQRIKRILHPVAKAKEANGNLNAAKKLKYGLAKKRKFHINKAIAIATRAQREAENAKQKQLSAEKSRDKYYLLALKLAENAKAAKKKAHEAKARRKKLVNMMPIIKNNYSKPPRSMLNLNKHILY